MSLGEHMSYWEVHSLRNLVTGLLLEVQVYARDHPDAHEMAARCIAMKDLQTSNQLAEMHDTVVRQLR